MSSVVNVEKCAVCGGRAIKQILTLPIAEFVGSGNSDHSYDLASLQLSGREPMGYAFCRDCSFTFASPTTDATLEMATYNAAKAGQASEKTTLWADDDAYALYQTHHKWVELNPVVIALGFHFQRFRRPRNDGQKQLRLLDVGCGYGHTLEIARVFGVEATGCEIDESRLKICHDKGLKAVTPKNVRGNFDIVTSCNVIEHVYDLKSYLNLVREKIAHGGVFVFTGIEKSIFDVELRRQHFKLLHPVEHRNIFTRRSLERVLADHGLRLVTRSELFVVMKQVRSKAPLYIAYWFFSGFVPFKGAFSAIARRV